MDYTEIAKRIIELKEADDRLRTRLVQKGGLGKGYDSAMEELHNQNADALSEIIDNMGFPTKDKVGQEANEATWLIVQHSIGRPLFMKRCLMLLESLSSSDELNLRYKAYLTDRIRTFEGELQLYGTQFDWNKNGELTPCLYDDIGEVNKRRNSIGLNTLEEQTKLMKRRAEEEGQLPPENFLERQQEMENWKREVGWIK